MKSEFVVSMPQLLGNGFASADNERAQQVATMEDLFPAPFYTQAVLSYFQRWQPLIFNTQQKSVRSHLEATDFGAEGVVKSASALFESVGLSGNYDRFGIAQEAVTLVQKQGDANHDLIQELNKRLQKLCRFLQAKIEDSEQAQKTSTGQSNIRRKLHDFQKGKRRASTRQLMTCFDQIKKELDYLGADGDNLRMRVSQCQHELSALENVGVEVLEDKAWEKWNAYITTLGKTLWVLLPHRQLAAKSLS